VGREMVRTHCSGAFDWVAGLGAVAFACLFVSNGNQYGAREWDGIPIVFLASMWS